MADWTTYHWLGLIAVALAGVLVNLLEGKSIRCLLGIHKDGYGGMRHGMVFRDGQRGVVGSIRPLKQCIRCGRVK